MKKQPPSPRPAAAWAIILERGYSESFIAKVENDDGLAVMRSPCSNWLAADATFAIVALPMREGDIDVRTMYVEGRENLPEAIEQITAYLSGVIGGGKRISWAQGGALSPETKETIRQTLGTLPEPWAFN